MKKPLEINYAFTKEGIAAFLDSVMGDIMDKGECNCISVTIGTHNILVPMYPETYESIDGFLTESLEIVKEEYSNVEN